MFSPASLLTNFFCDSVAACAVDTCGVISEGPFWRPACVDGLPCHSSCSSGCASLSLRMSIGSRLLGASAKSSWPSSSPSSVGALDDSTELLFSDLPVDRSSRGLFESRASSFWGASSFCCLSSCSWQNAKISLASATASSNVSRASHLGRNAASSFVNGMSL